MMSPVQAANPLIRASPLPLPRCSTTLTSGHSSRATCDRVVGGVAVDQDHFVDPVGQGLEDVRKVLRLVHRRDDDAHRRRDGQMRGDGPVADWSGGSVSGGPGSAVGRAQERAHESGPSRPVDRPPPGGPAGYPVRKGGSHSGMHGMDLRPPGELAKLAGRATVLPAARQARSPVRSPSTAPPYRAPHRSIVVLEPSPGAACVMDRCGWMYDGIDDWDPMARPGTRPHVFVGFDRYRRGPTESFLHPLEQAVGGREQLRPGQHRVAQRTHRRTARAMSQRHRVAPRHPPLGHRELTGLEGVLVFLRPRPRSR